MSTRPPVDFDFKSIFLLLEDMGLDQKVMWEWSKEECQKFFERVYDCAFPRRSLQQGKVAEEGKGSRGKVQKKFDIHKKKPGETYLARMDT